MRKNRGQSTLEYILILAAIIVAIAVLGKGLIRVGTENVLKDAKGVVDQASDKLSEHLGLRKQPNSTFQPSTKTQGGGTTGNAGNSS